MLAPLRIISAGNGLLLLLAAAETNALLALQPPPTPPATPRPVVCTVRAGGNGELSGGGRMVCESDSRLDCFLFSIKSRGGELLGESEEL